VNNPQDAPGSVVVPAHTRWPARLGGALAGGLLLLAGAGAVAAVIIAPFVAGLDAPFTAIVIVAAGLVAAWLAAYLPLRLGGVAHPAAVVWCAVPVLLVIAAALVAVTAGIAYLLVLLSYAVDWSGGLALPVVVACVAVGCVLSMACGLFVTSGFTRARARRAAAAR
jgi:hypothetical protein